MCSNNLRFFAGSGRTMSTVMMYWMLTYTPWYVSCSFIPSTGCHHAHSSWCRISVCRVTIAEDAARRS